jgi:hypothetical protein
MREVYAVAALGDKADQRGEEDEHCSFPNAWVPAASVSCASAGDVVVLARCMGLGTCAWEGQGEGWLELGREAAFLLFFFSSFLS